MSSLIFSSEKIEDSKLPVYAWKLNEIVSIEKLMGCLKKYRYSVKVRAKLGYKEGKVPKIWCFRAVVLEKALESLLDNKIKPINP